MTTVPIRETPIEVDRHVVPMLTAGDAGDPVVLVHGAGANRCDWQHNIGVLGASHRAFAPDLIGFGDYRVDGTVYTAEILARFLRRFMTALDVERASLVGHSLGGRVCLELARLEPDRVDKLVLVAPMGFGRLTLRAHVLTALAWGVHKALRKPLPYPNMDIPLAVGDPTAYTGVTQPSLLIWGSRDFYFPPSHGELAQSLLPNAGLLIYQGANHSPHKVCAQRFNLDAMKFLCGELVLPRLN